MLDKRGGPAGGDTGSVLVLALLLVTLLSLLGLTLLATATTEHSIAFNAFWSEGALAAADAGVNTGLSQLSADQTATDAAVGPTTMGDAYSSYTFRSGHRADAGPQPFQFVSSRHERGYSLVSGSNQYNTSGYDFDNHQFNATGTGPRNAIREVEVQAEFGPILR